MALLAMFATAAAAQTAAETMAQSSVVVFGTVMENGKAQLVSRGGGFMIDSRHVVTNLTACCGKTDKGEMPLPVAVAGPKEATTAKIVWSNAETDLAILELKEPLNHPAPALAPFKTVEKDQAVYTVQYPDPGESGAPKVVEGKLLSLVKIEGSGVQVYKTSATMNKANSGGALFDACGNVIGVNMMMKDGAQYAYVVDPLLNGLRTAGLQATVTDTHCGSGATSGNKPENKKEETQQAREWRIPEGVEWIPVVLLLAAIAMAFRSPSKRVSQAAFTGGVKVAPLPEPETYVPGPVLGTGTRPVLRGIAGQYAGKSFSLDAGPSILGRDQRAANLVFAPEADSISKRHCMVSWDAARRTFVLLDFGSTNGTFLATGERLIPGQPRDVAPGTRFFIGDLRNQFELRID
jgi:hypothetical protein